jgi:hypothetical protein
MDPLLLVPSNTTYSSRYDIVNYIELHINVSLYFLLLQYALTLEVKT